MGYTTEFQGQFEVTSTASTYKERMKSLDEFNTVMKEVYETRHGDNCREWQGFPSFYCQWIFDPKECVVKWDGGEKFYRYVEWLKIVIELANQQHLLLNGEVKWRGEDFDDVGTIIVENNRMTVKEGW